MAAINSNEYEFLNLYIVLIDLPALVVLGRYIWGLGGRKLRDPELGLGIGLAVYISGHMLVRAWTWLLRFWVAQGWGEFPLGEWTATVLFVGLVIITGGLVLIIRGLYSTVPARIWAGCAVAAAALAWYLTYAL